MSRVGARQLDFPFQINPRHIQVVHCHIWIDMTKQSHQCRQTNTGPKYLGCVCVVTIPGPA